MATFRIQSKSIQSRVALEYIMDKSLVEEAMELRSYMLDGSFVSVLKLLRIVTE